MKDKQLNVLKKKKHFWVIVIFRYETDHYVGAKMIVSVLQEKV